MCIKLDFVLIGDKVMATSEHNCFHDGTCFHDVNFFGSSAATIKVAQSHITFKIC